MAKTKTKAAAAVAKRPTIASRTQPAKVQRNKAQSSTVQPERVQSKKVHSNKVNAYCNACQSQIGVFTNEWVRLTSAYARPKDKGASFDTRTGDTTRVVPDGVAHKMAAGCEMAELFCESCSTIVGQYCKSAPKGKREHMLDYSFYKFSKISLRDAKSGDARDALFAEGSEAAPPTPKRKSSVAVSSPLPRPRTIPAPRSSPQVRSGGSIENGSGLSPSKDKEGEDQSSLITRLLELERLVRAGASTTANAPNGLDTLPAPPPQPLAQHAYNQPAAHNEHIIEDQRKQIASITAQVDNLQGTIDELRGVIQDLKAEKVRQQSVSLQENAVLNKFDEMIRSVRDGNGPSTLSEADSLRAENQQLKDRLSTIAGAMGTSPTEAIGSSPPQPGSASSLGKRKRNKGRAKVDSQPQQNGNDPFHPPTPESLHEATSGQRPTPALPPAQPMYQHQATPMPYGLPNLRHHYSDPNMGYYSQPPPAPMYYQQPTGLPQYTGYGNRQYAPPPVTRPDSRLAAPRASTARPSSGEGVDFSDDEIVTANASDAPLSVPRPRPIPPPSMQQPLRIGDLLATPNYAWSNPNFQPPVKHNFPEWRPTPYSRSMTCKTLRQPAMGQGMHYALNYTPAEVKKRIVKKKTDSDGDRSTKEESVAVSTRDIPRPATAQANRSQMPPIDPAMRREQSAEADAGPRPAKRSSQDTITDYDYEESDEDNEDGPYKPGRGSAKRNKDRRNGNKLRALDADLEEQDELAAEVVVIDEDAD